MKTIPPFLTADLARSDLSRISRELFELQRQSASGFKHEDLRGFGDTAGRVISFRSVFAQSTARAETAERAVARLEVQDLAITRIESAADDLRGKLFSALTASNGQSLQASLEAAFVTFTATLNEHWEDAPLFSGEASDANVSITNAVTNLTSGATAASLFRESARSFEQDFGEGFNVKIGIKASDFATDLFVALGQVQEALLATPGDFGTPLSAAASATLEAALSTLDRGLSATRTALGQNGVVLQRTESFALRERNRADLITRELGEVADADLAIVAMRLSAAQTQYEAAARVFSQIRELSLVNFLG
jgi:flagellin-like hook-associated protein FlgL